MSRGKFNRRPSPGKAAASVLATGNMPPSGSPQPSGPGKINLSADMIKIPPNDPAPGIGNTLMEHLATASNITYANRVQYTLGQMGKDIHLVGPAEVAKAAESWNALRGGQPGAAGAADAGVSAAPPSPGAPPPPPGGAGAPPPQSPGQAMMGAAG